VRKTGCVTSGRGKIRSTQRAEEIVQKPFIQQVAGFAPILVAGKRQLVEVATRATRGKHKGIGKQLCGDGDGTAVAAMSTKDRAVKVTVCRLRRIDAGALGAGLRHFS